MIESTSVREYWMPYRYFCGIKYAAAYGKTCSRLCEAERIMCECAEMDLEDAGRYFRGKRAGREGSAPVIFRDYALKIPALEHAARELQTDRISAAFEIGIVPARCEFPEFSEAVKVRHPSGSIYYTWHTKPRL